MLTRILFNTRLGDLICSMIESLTGCALVPLADIDDIVEATPAGRAAATSGAPTRG
jgi:hypothetical protein